MASYSYVAKIGFVPGSIYTVGGLTPGGMADVFDMHFGTTEYNTTTKAWASKTELPAEALKTAYMSASTVGLKGYYFGGAEWDTGFTGTDQNWEFFPPASWTSRAPMPSPARDRATAFTLGGYVYLCGGWDSGNVLSGVDEYNPAGDTWADGTPRPIPTAMGTARRYLASFVAAGKAYVGGGDNASGVSQAVMEEFDGSSWTTKTPPSPARRGWAAMAIGGKGYFAGGITYLTQNVEYDPGGDAWTVKTSMPSPGRQFHTASYASGTAGVVIGGKKADRGEKFARNTDEYDADTDSWAVRADMPRPARFAHASTRI